MPSFSAVGVSTSTMLAAGRHRVRPLHVQRRLRRPAGAAAGRPVAPAPGPAGWMTRSEAGARSPKRGVEARQVARRSSASRTSRRSRSSGPRRRCPAAAAGRCYSPARSAPGPGPPAGWPDRGRVRPAGSATSWRAVMTGVAVGGRPADRGRAAGYAARYAAAPAPGRRPPPPPTPAAPCRMHTRFPIRAATSAAGPPWPYSTSRSAAFGQEPTACRTPLDQLGRDLVRRGCAGCRRRRPRRPRAPGRRRPRWPRRRRSRPRPACRTSLSRAAARACLAARVVPGVEHAPGSRGKAAEARLTPWPT